LIINILSHPRNHAKRNSQRETWIQNLPPNIQYQFIIGNPDYAEWESNESRARFEEEMKQHEDMVLFYEAIESYRGISKKVLLAIEDSVHKFPNARYVAKTDDDIYVAVRNVEKIIEIPREKYYAGKIKSKHYAHRERSSRWYTTYEEWPDDKTPYPDFAAGAFYFLSIDAAKECAVLFRHPEYKIFPYEDVQTGIIMNRFGVPAVQIDVVETGEPGDGMIANHYGGIDTMWEFHKRFGKSNISHP
jgi:hypothetical protein